jgi:hypothetical protein
MVEAPSRYDDRMLDALGQQRYTESQIIYNRQLNDYEERLKDLERQRKLLEDSFSSAAYENDIADAPPDSAESERMDDFQSATFAAQARTAQASARAETLSAVIENERDTAIAEAEGRAAKAIAVLEQRGEDTDDLNEQRIVVAIANAESERRVAAEIADITQKIEILKAEHRTLIAARMKEIEQHKLQIAALESEIKGVEAEVQNLAAREAAAIGPHTAKLGVLREEASRLAEISAKLLSPDTSKAQASAAYIATRRAEIIASLATEKARIASAARLELAETKTNEVLEVATVVAPVVTGRKVYAGDYGIEPKPFVHIQTQTRQTAVAATPPATESPARNDRPSKPIVTPVARPKDPILVVDRFEPKLGVSQSQSERNSVGSVVITSSSTSAGTAKPIVVVPSTRTAFNVVYTYSEKGGFDQFQRYLEAYGINDITATEHPSRKEYIIWAGRYYTAEDAARRIDHLNKVTSTSHATILRQGVSR